VTKKAIYADAWRTAYGQDAADKPPKKHCKEWDFSPPPRERLQGIDHSLLADPTSASHALNTPVRERPGWDTSRR